ncbi:hypothetical protein BZZ01_21705 [Nostocales cyanobacterium HT-58-2]|nr:hypothetical protein BZZ01_21705 [Nostocales cyanobacterium HT-58-2]
MKVLSMSLLVSMLLINLLVASPSWAEGSSSLVSNPDYFEVGQKVVWLYKARADSEDVQKIPAEVVKLGAKQVQIKVRKNNKFIYRWVNRNRLENFSKIKEQSQIQLHFISLG